MRKLKQNKKNMQKKLRIWTTECWNYEIKLKKSEQSANVRSECLFYDKTVKLLHQKRRNIWKH